MPDETTLLADECAAEASTWLATVADIAAGAAPESAIPLLLLTTSQIQLVGARLGAITDVVLEERFEDDAGPDTDLDPLRAGLAQLLGEVDEYADVADPVTSPEPSTGSLSNDLAIIAGALAHGLAHHEAGRATEALWWWQFSYLSGWGERGAMALRVIHSVVAHVRLDADPDTVAEAEFDALNR